MVNYFFKKIARKYGRIDTWVKISREIYFFYKLFFAGLVVYDTIR